MKKFSFLRKGKTVLILFTFFLFLFSFSLVSTLDISQDSQLDDVTGVNIIIPEVPINYSLIPTVNSTDWWDNLNFPNSTQMENSDSQLNIKEFWLTSFGNNIWCALTGCTMIGDIRIKDSDGDFHNLSRDLQLADEMNRNITLTGLNGTFNAGTNNLTVTTLSGDNIVVNIDKNESILDRNSDSIIITSGTNESPILNQVFYTDSANPILAKRTTLSLKSPSVAAFLQGANFTYASAIGLATTDGLIGGIFNRFFRDGSTYRGGFDINVSTDTVNISTGLINFLFSEVNITSNHSTSDLYVHVHSDGSFHQHTSLDDCVSYNDGSAISNNKYFNMVLGIAITHDGAGVMYVTTQDPPSTEYIKAIDAEIDREDTINFFPPDDIVSLAYIPVVRVVVRLSGGVNTIQTLSNGLLFDDLRGTITKTSSSPPPSGITAHSDLTNLVWSLAGHTIDDTIDMFDNNITNMSYINPEGTTAYFGGDVSVNGGITIDKSSNQLQIKRGSIFINLNLDSNGDLIFDNSGGSGRDVKFSLLGKILSLSEVVIDKTSTEAFLVEGANDVFVVDTQNRRVGINGPPMVGAFTMTGVTDFIQVRIVGHSTQTADILEIRSNVGDLLFTVDNSGNVDSGGAITGTSFIGNGSLLHSVNETDPLSARYQFTNNNFNGSGNFTTIGTGTFTDLVVDTNLILTDSVNNWVGIGRTPVLLLDVGDSVTPAMGIYDRLSVGNMDDSTAETVRAGQFVAEFNGTTSSSQSRIQGLNAFGVTSAISDQDLTFSLQGGGLKAGRYIVQHRGSGTVGLASSIVGYLKVFGNNGVITTGANFYAEGSDVVGSGSMTTFYNYFGQQGVGSVTNAYGLYLGAVTRGSSINNAIFSEGGKWVIKQDGLDGSLSFGEGGENVDSWTYWDGSNQIWNITGSGRFEVYNSSGLGTMRVGQILTSSKVPDVTNVNYLSKLDNVANWLNPDGSINYETHPSYTLIDVKDPNNCWDVLESTRYCYLTNNSDTSGCSGTKINENDWEILGILSETIDEIYVTECGTKLDYALDLEKRVSDLEGMAYELKQENIMLNQIIESWKPRWDEICLKNNTYSWCI